jgi:hypothetical protein
VNHQYDKSSHFLSLAQDYVHKYLNNSLNLTSELSGMWELEIARIFCLEKELKKFHRLFLSCNEPINGVKKKGEKHNNSKKENELVKYSDKKKSKEGKKIRKEEKRWGKGSVVEDSIEIVEMVKTDVNSQTKCEWCCECEKCAFIFLLLSAWMPRKGELRWTYCTALYSTLLYSTLLYSTLLYSTLPYSTLLYSTRPLHSNIIVHHVIMPTLSYACSLHFLECRT